MGNADLEFAWVDPRPVQPLEQARVLDTYVRRGIYTVNEARDILGFGPIAGGELLGSTAMPDPCRWLNRDQPVPRNRDRSRDWIR